ncbi:MAG: hypothetical protein JWQ89_228 [Devosia sp.]|uniref:DUF72 domain-containing protein n=1 Tax=Devosia sp. TaxID=1871048 RepID=UPI00260C9D78|nr:DUF72 domain-containing protein [Devosia sp.]MDB5538501.1 hypothetical protein [Devosia sp.]
MASTTLTPDERRAKRAAARVKQREITVLRASKMHHARLLAEQAGIVPDDSGPGSLNIGCSGWFYWHLKGSFYPSQMPTKDWFSHYADHFSTVELNAPFYSWPTLGTVQSWLKQSEGRKMVYTVKVSELITHIKKFEDTATLVRDFGYIADLLGSQMGCFLFQLPPSYHYSPTRLHGILEQLDPCRRNVVEFRHPSWWNDDVYAAFKEAGAIFCSCSGPRLPDPVIKTADDIYIRFHGVERWYRHDYSHRELTDWASRIRDAHAKRVWIYFNNDFNGYAIKNATMLSEILCGGAAG